MLQRGRGNARAARCIDRAAKERRQADFRLTVAKILVMMAFIGVSALKLKRGLTRCGLRERNRYAIEVGIEAHMSAACMGDSQFKDRGLCPLWPDRLQIKHIRSRSKQQRGGPFLVRPNVLRHQEIFSNTSTSPLLTTCGTSQKLNHACSLHMRSHLKRSKMHF